MYRYIKRTIDFMLALVAVIVLSPILIVISILIKFESEGPLLFIQKRSGRMGTFFNIYKFRSMKVGTPDIATSDLWNLDRYITKMGRFIRKTSLDELPQLLNILKGEMSFVGPRPALYNQYELIKERSARGINTLTPGITGYAQIMGRDFISDEQKVKYDCFYLENISLLLDFKIIFLTFYKVVKAENVKG